MVMIPGIKIIFTKIFFNFMANMLFADQNNYVAYRLRYYFT